MVCLPPSGETETVGTVTGSEKVNCTDCGEAVPASSASPSISEITTIGFALSVMLASATVSFDGLKFEVRSPLPSVLAATVSVPPDLPVPVEIGNVAVIVEPLIVALVGVFAL